MKINPKSPMSHKEERCLVTNDYEEGLSVVSTRKWGRRNMV